MEAELVTVPEFLHGLKGNRLGREFVCVHLNGGVSFVFALQDARGWYCRLGIVLSYPRLGKLPIAHLAWKLKGGTGVRAAGGQQHDEGNDA